MLVPLKFADMLRDGKLPSGNDFELMPDTVGIGLKVSEIDVKQPWKKKIKQAAVVTATIAGHNIQAMAPKEQEVFFGGLLDVDVHFLSMAWSAQANGCTVKLSDGATSVNCPTCNAVWREIPYGDIEFFSRLDPLSGPDAIFPVDITKTDLPMSLRDGEFHMVDPTWLAARVHVPEHSWTDPTVIGLNRVLSVLRFKGAGSDAGPPRALSRTAELLQLRVRVVTSVTEAMDRVIPHIADQFALVCPACSSETTLPFDLGL